MKALVGPFNQEKALVYAFSNSRRQVSHDNTTVAYAGRDTTLCWSEPRSGVQWPLAAPLVSAAAAEHQLRSGPASRSTVQPHHTIPAPSTHAMVDIMYIVLWSSIHFFVLNAAYFWKSHIVTRWEF